MSKVVSAAEAKAKLSDLLDRAARGEEITITGHGKPVARIVPPASEIAAERTPGAWKGLVSYDPDVFFEPPTEQDLKDWEGDLDEFLAMPMPGESAPAKTPPRRKLRRRA
ncbi:type II toxin-antitoxin system Phd/YefM family antitoxin [Elioraea tepidiphila]|jgi:prevent-host-death family protein|uniref:type II toxin-antitoxin system Phd/YefM family antitoxin n=1 Tax=Elioraea tepidiphila TaxID=457934 RepID=UPI000378333B|nr:type II toxin-antitoxin system prevent-host-death family antitoxin [Elioraea tepidiphila]